jgi:DNA-binding NtrC family response regulator
LSRPVNKQPKVKILLIEDDPEHAQLIREMLRTGGGASFDVECADWLSTGLERLAAGGIDVVLLDLTLPDSRGLDTFATVRAQAPSVPVIVLSGLLDGRLADEAVRRGAQDFLVKGKMDSRQLVQTVCQAAECGRAE